jgi:hypothetical protein
VPFSSKRRRKTATILLTPLMFDLRPVFSALAVA